MRYIAKQNAFMIRTKLVLLSVFIFFSSTFLKAQGNLPDIDNKFFHFGFTVGLSTMDFGIVPSLTDIDGNVYHADVSNLLPGFTVGIISDLRLNRYLSLRVNPVLNLDEREIVYTADNNATSRSVKITSIPVCLPVYLKYSAERYRNFRPYLIGGGGLYYDLGRETDKPVLLKPFDIYAEFGVGCDIYFSFFRLAPELKFALGTNNMLTPLAERNTDMIDDNDKLLTNALSKLTSRMITLSFNFE